MAIIKIAIAIPTYNRLSKLRFALERIEQQKLTGLGVQLYCIISNSCSDDGTTEFLKELKSEHIQYIIWNTPDIVDGKPRWVDGRENFLHCLDLTPQDIDWLWMMGDDDYLVSNNVIEQLAKVLRAHNSPSLSLIHLCQARRSRKTGKILHGELFELCNQIGYHEMLGWISSMVIRRQRAFEAFNCELFRTSNSAYPQSAALLEKCHRDEALFVDSDWVEPQDAQQTPESIERWKKENMGERYFYVIDDLVSLYGRGILPKKCRPVFFRYLTYSLWDRFATYLIAEAVNTTGMGAKAREHWVRMHRIADFFENPADKKMYIAWLSALFKQVERLAATQQELQLLKTQLIDSHKQLSASSYPFTNLLS
jgi:abequosyltransferase